MLVAHSCDACSSAPLAQYKNHQIDQEITISRTIGRILETVGDIFGT